MDEGARRDRRWRSGGDRSRRDRAANRISAIAAAVVLAVPAGCGGDDRPSDADWAVEWARDRSAVPTADEVLDGGQPLCDELVGEFREVLSRLTPTPTEALDDAVTAWIDHAESIAFDCPGDPAELQRRYDELDVLEAEIDAGLRTDSG